jgi:WD40 repeat protein
VELTVHHTNQRTGLIKKLHNIFAPSQAVNLPSRLSQLSVSTVNPDSGPRELITFNDQISKELDVEIAHELFHEDIVWSVNFSQDGKFLAVGCRNGRAYIYDVQTGFLSR